MLGRRGGRWGDVRSCGADKQLRDKGLGVACNWYPTQASGLCWVGKGGGLQEAAARGWDPSSGLRAVGHLATVGAELSRLRAMAAVGMS
jgi:hypothetical protein